MKVLLLEDEYALRNIYIKLIEKTGAHVIAAPDGWEGFKEGSLNDYHLVVSDYMMPNMNGFECMETLLVMNPSLKFIFISGIGNDQIINSLKAHESVYAFLTKPVKGSVLIQTIEAYATTVT